jgi:hypothetical protein
MGEVFGGSLRVTARRTLHTRALFELVKCGRDCARDEPDHHNPQEVWTVKRTMEFVPMLIIVWGIATLAFLALTIWITYQNPIPEWGGPHQ